MSIELIVTWASICGGLVPAGAGFRLVGKTDRGRKSSTQNEIEFAFAAAFVERSTYATISLLLVVT